MILGKKSFVKETLRKLNPKALQNKDVSHRRLLHSPLALDDFSKLMSDTLKIPMERITEKGRYRNLAMYVLKKQTGLTNKEIGRYFGGITYSAVTKSCERLERSAETDRSLQHDIKRLTKAISQIKG